MTLVGGDYSKDWSVLLMCFSAIVVGLRTWSSKRRLSHQPFGHAVQENGKYNLKFCVQQKTNENNNFQKTTHKSI